MSARNWDAFVSARVSFVPAAWAEIMRKAAELQHAVSQARVTNLNLSAGARFPLTAANLARYEI
jgi:hypothetical protein